MSVSNRWEFCQSWLNWFTDSLIFTIYESSKQGDIKSTTDNHWVSKSFHTCLTRSSSVQKKRVFLLVMKWFVDSPTQSKQTDTNVMQSYSRVFIFILVSHLKKRMHYSRTSLTNLIFIHNLNLNLYLISCICTSFVHATLLKSLQ